MKAIAIILAAATSLAVAGCDVEPGQTSSNGERAAAMLFGGAAAFGDGYTSRSSSRITCTSIAGITTCD